MKEVKVYLRSMEEIQKFVSVTSKFPVKLDLMPQDDDETRVSGKSVMGFSVWITPIHFGCASTETMRVQKSSARP